MQKEGSSGVDPGKSWCCPGGWAWGRPEFALWDGDFSLVECGFLKLLNVNFAFVKCWIYKFKNFP